MNVAGTGRSREGAWIEIPTIGVSGIMFFVAPARERGLKFSITSLAVIRLLVAPARERGLK